MYITFFSKIVSKIALEKSDSYKLPTLSRCALCARGTLDTYPNSYSVITDSTSKKSTSTTRKPVNLQYCQ